MKQISTALKPLKLFLIVILVICSLSYLLANEAKPSQASIDQTITDISNNGIIDLTDARIQSPPASTSCIVCVDVNGDKQITQKDIDLVKYYAGLGDTNEGSTYVYKSRMDINNDGQLSQEDVNIVQNYLGQSVESPAFGLSNPSELTFGFIANEVLVKFKPSAAGSEKGSIASKYNLVNKGSFSKINAEHYITQDDNVENLQKQLNSEPNVEKTYKDHVGEVATDDPYWDDQWGHKKIKIEETWFTETTGSTNNPVKVVILDAGFDTDHFDLQRNLSSIRRNAWVDEWEENATDVSRAEFHGTFMAGIIGATANNLRGISGLAHNVEIIPVKVGFNDPVSNGEERVRDTVVAKGFDWAMNQEGVKVINMSFHLGYIDEDAYLVNWYLEIAREFYGITLVAGAGNDGRDDCAYPANHQNVVCVGATKSDDTLCHITSSGQKDADILAPGKNIVSTLPIEMDPEGIYEVTHCGTSLATAYVSGVAALCRTVRPLPESIEITREDLKCKNFANNGFGRIDAWSTIWRRNCFKLDFNNDGHIDTIDIAQIAFRAGTSKGNLLYSNRYDVEPVGTNGRIDIGDAYFILQRNHLDCPER